MFDDETLPEPEPEPEPEPKKKEDPLMTEPDATQEIDGLLGDAPKQKGQTRREKPAHDLWPDYLGTAHEYMFPVSDSPPALRSMDYNPIALAQRGDLALIAQTIQCGGHLWLSGHKGTGKTTFAMSLAQVCQRPFIRIQHHAQTEALDLIGSKGLEADEQGTRTVFEPGILLSAIAQRDAVILLDEPTLAALTLPVYQSVLDEGFIQHDGVVYHVAPGVTFICADNTTGAGDTHGIYHGTAATNAAYMDRFDAIVELQYLPANAEADMLHRDTELALKACHNIARYAAAIRDNYVSGSCSEPISYRRLRAFAHAIRHGVERNVALTGCVLRHVINPTDRELYIQLANAQLNTNVGKGASR